MSRESLCARIVAMFAELNTPGLNVPRFIRCSIAAAQSGFSLNIFCAVFCRRGVKVA